MAEIKSESVADFIPESVAGLLRNQHRGLAEAPVVAKKHLRNSVACAGKS
jgi:hypothetical protein